MHNYNLIVKEGKELMKTKTGEAKSVLERKLSDLKQDWDNVCQLSVARQQKLEEAGKKLRQFEAQLNPMKAWMTKILPFLDNTEPVHGDIDTVRELLESHSVSNTIKL